MSEGKFDKHTANSVLLFVQIICQNGSVRNQERLQTLTTASTGSSGCDVVTFPYGFLAQVQYLIVSIPDLCLLHYFVESVYDNK